MTSETLPIPVLNSVQYPEDLHKLQNSSLTSTPRRGRMVPIITRTALATVGVGVCIGLPMLQSLHPVDTFVMPPPGITDTGVTPSLPSPSGEPVTEQPRNLGPSVIPIVTPTQVYVASVCETQSGTIEGQLPSGEPILPGTADRPSIFVVSPDRSDEQSFSVRSAGASDADWQTVSEAEDVGIVGIATADTQFRTGDGRAVWSRSCESTSHTAVEEAEFRANNVCERREFGLREVVVYHIGADGKPVEMNRRDC